MENENFDWQGKKKENVEFSYKMIFLKKTHIYYVSG